MAKRKKSGGNSITRLLLMVLIGAGLLVFVALGGDIEQLQDQLEEAGIIEVDEDGNIGLPDGSGNDVVVEQPPVTGEFYELYFTASINSNDEADHTGAQVEQALIREIDAAQSTIDAALFELNAPDTTAALIRAVDRGVRVRIVFDDDHALQDPESTAEEVASAGAQAIDDSRSALMHNKFFVFDEQKVWTGSMNITRNGIYNNNNNALLITSQALVENYETEFNEMFNDGIFTDRDDAGTLPNRTIQIGDTNIETYFAPENGDVVVERLVELVDAANTSVRVMAFSLTLDELGDALIRAHDRGVDVQVVVETVGSLRGQLTPLVCAGVPGRQDGNPNILHHKVFVIDGQIVATGSLNFSNNARENNSENVLVITNPELATAYGNEWQARFDEGRVPPAEDINC